MVTGAIRAREACIPSLAYRDVTATTLDASGVVDLMLRELIA